jgi:hypothetical protein
MRQASRCQYLAADALSGRRSPHCFSGPEKVTSKHHPGACAGSAVGPMRGHFQNSKPVDAHQIALRIEMPEANSM